MQFGYNIVVHADVLNMWHICTLSWVSWLYLSIMYLKIQNWLFSNIYHWSDLKYSRAEIKLHKNGFEVTIWYIFSTEGGKLHIK